jgi:hypothetical protein
MGQWWIAPGHNNGTVCIDDALLYNIDCSSVPANIDLIFWYGQNGEILYQVGDRPRIREPFIDITPYIAIFDKWMVAAETTTPPLTLPQSKFVKTQEVDALFASKRQLPMSYLGYLWDGSDEATGAMSDQIAAITAPPDPSGAINSATAALATSVNQSFAALIGSVNSAHSTIESTSDAANAALAGGSGAGYVVDEVNSINDSFAGDNATAVNNMLAELQSGITYAISQHAVLINGLLAGGVPPGTALDGTQPTFAGASFTDATKPSIVSVPSVSAPDVSVPPVSATPVPPVDAPNILWPPIGAPPVPLTYTQFTTLLGMLTQRRNALQIQRTNHKNNIIILTTIAAVVAYDITTGW